MKQLSFFGTTNDFLLFGHHHLLVVFLTIVLAILLPIYAKRNLRLGQQIQFSRGMAIVISFWAIFYMAMQFLLGDFDYKRDLPFDICNLTALLLPFLMWKPTQRVNEILYFWILAGTTQAIITPDLPNGFPHFIFFKYWFIHSGLVIFIIYTTYVFELRPTLRSIWRAFLALQLYILCVIGINLLIGSNYVYVLRKPTVPSALDYMGPWPWYILVGEFVAVFLFFLTYLPFWAFAKKKKQVV